MYDLDRRLRWSATDWSLVCLLSQSGFLLCHNAQRINLEAVPMRERWDLLELPRLHPWSAARGARPLMWRSSVSGPFAQY